MPKLALVRHGQSEWNAASLFTGWADVELTTLGKNEAAMQSATTIEGGKQSCEVVDISDDSNSSPDNGAAQADHWRAWRADRNPSLPR